MVVTGVPRGARHGSDGGLSGLPADTFLRLAVDRGGAHHARMAKDRRDNRDRYACQHSRNLRVYQAIRVTPCATPKLEVRSRKDRSAAA